MKADQPAIAPSSTAMGTRPPGLPVHHAPDAWSSSVRRGGSAVMSARFLSLALGAQQREDVLEALLEDRIGELSVR